MNLIMRQRRAAEIRSIAPSGRIITAEAETLPEIPRTAAEVIAAAVMLLAAGQDTDKAEETGEGRFSERLFFNGTVEGIYQTAEEDFFPRTAVCEKEIIPLLLCPGLTSAGRFDIISMLWCVKIHKTQ